MRSNIVWESLLFNFVPLGYPDKVWVREIEWFPFAPEPGQRSQNRREHSLGWGGVASVNPNLGTDERREYPEVELSVYKLF